MLSNFLFGIADIVMSSLWSDQDTSDGSRVQEPALRNEIRVERRPFGDDRWERELLGRRAICKRSR